VDGAAGIISLHPDFIGMRFNTALALAGGSLRFGGFGTTLSWSEGLRSDVGGRGTLAFGYGGFLGGRWFGSVALSGTWSDADQMAWEFGVSPDQAAARSALLAAGDPRLRAGEDRVYAPRAGWRDGALTGLLTFVQDRHWRWFCLARVEAFGAEVKASPLVRQATQGTLGFGFSYAF
jgi:outer membrane scaffolding protein for murein synthesis (MipA/OmpV family)